MTFRTFQMMLCLIGGFMTTIGLVMVSNLAIDEDLAFWMMSVGTIMMYGSVFLAFAPRMWRN